MVQRIVLASLLILGLLIIFYHETVIEQVRSVFEPADNRDNVATLTTYKGKVRYKLPKSLKYNNVRENLSLKDQDTLTTDADSTARVVFSDGFELEINPNSMIIIEKPKISSTGAVQITFLRGDYTVVNEGSGEAGKIVIASKDKKFQDVAGRPPLEPIKIKIQEEPQIEKGVKLEEQKPVLPPIVEKTPIPKKKKQRETLPDEYIASVVNNQKPFFNRCYAQHLRLNPDSRGQINLAFTIDDQGKVTAVNLVNSTMGDPQLDRCTMAVLERCRFRPYDGDPIVVNYPINFE